MQISWNIDRENRNSGSFCSGTGKRLLLMVGYCDIYITGVRKESLGWVDDPDAFLDDVAENISDIPRFTFISVSLNMVQAYNYQLKVASYEAMMIYLKGVRYFGKSDFSLQESLDLETKIGLYISYIYGFSYENIEIRTSKKYDIKELSGGI
jgi:hypothetical protein